MFDTPPLNSAPDAAPGAEPYEQRTVIDRSTLPVGERPRAIALTSDADIASRLAEASTSATAGAQLNVVRIVNIVIAGTALVLLMPVMVLVGLAIKVFTPGPLIYAQTRVGQDRRRQAIPQSRFDRRSCNLGGRVFRIYKFRTMRVDAERRGVQWATKNDPRVTPLGRLLRQTRLDELPQLINVVRGDMNIVGPRPERPSIVRRLAESIEEYPLRHRAKPGITGLAQINQAYDTTLDDVRAKVRYDLEYIRRQSVAEDLRIMLCTMPAMLFRRGGW